MNLEFFLSLYHSLQPCFLMWKLIKIKLLPELKSFNLYIEIKVIHLEVVQTFVSMVIVANQIWHVKPFKPQWVIDCCFFLIKHLSATLCCLFIFLLLNFLFSKEYRKKTNVPNDSFVSKWICLTAEWWLVCVLAGCCLGFRETTVVKCSASSCCVFATNESKMWDRRESRALYVSIGIGAVYMLVCVSICAWI